MMTIPIYQPTLSGNEKKYVNQCLDSNWISSKGDFIPRFEQAFSSFCGITYATTVSNGTVAMHLALLALGIGEGDEVIVPTFTYIASVNSIRYTGATPVFVDSMLNTLQMDPDDVRRKLTTKTKAIMVVHLYGHPCDMDALCSISSEHNLYMVEDCAEAIGSRYKGKHVGQFGNIATFSFFGNKTITTGEGGMVVTNDQDLIERVIKYKGQGLVRQGEYWHDVVGYNYRMTNICAAIGLAQLEQVDVFLKAKRSIAMYYKDHLKAGSILFHEEHPDVDHSYWMCSIMLPNKDIRSIVTKSLLDKGVETRPFFHPVHTMPMYLEAGLEFKVAEDIGERGINLPSYPGLSESELEYIVSTINDCLA
jgi:perosamine synthetase